MGIVEVLQRSRVPSILILGLVYVAYVMIGGAVFWTLEGDQQEDISGVLNAKARLLRTYTCLRQEGLEAVAKVITDASKVGMNLNSNNTADGFWKFHSSAVFAATVVTTIGYGNISPSTTAGQIFCVFFALFGIPLNMVVLNRVGKYMLVIERNICDFLQTKTKYRRSARFLVHLVSYLSGVALFFVVPMVVFREQESWTYAQAIYYCFITLSTIGFGDYVADSNPDKSYPDWYSFIMASWIFFGLAWLALVINHSGDILERLNSYFKGGCTKSSPQGEASDGDDGPKPESPSPDTQMEDVEDEEEVKVSPGTG